MVLEYFIPGPDSADDPVKEISKYAVSRKNIIGRIYPALTAHIYMELMALA